MKCSNPTFLKEKGLLVPCGTCHSCRSNYRDMWVERLSHHMITEKKGISLMLSYNDDNLPSDGCVSVRDVQLFIKRFRKFFNFTFRHDYLPPVIFKKSYILFASLTFLGTP